MALRIENRNEGETLSSNRAAGRGSVSRCYSSFMDACLAEFAVETAVAEAVARFNAGKKRASEAILKELHLNQGNTDVERCLEKDQQRLAACDKKHTRAEDFKNAMKKRRVKESDVMRTQGSLRVILNTKVWSGMVVEHPSSKTVRTSAIDPDGIRVYLIQANAKDAEQLYSALECRVASLKAAEDSGTGVSPVPAAMQGLPPSADSSSSFPESVGSLEDDGAPQSKRPRLQESDGSLPDSSHGEDSVATAECESSAEDKG
ncbi:hypothetical protein HPB51_000796 [Rhipicephalus microplus]|uniref:RanBD1 domain-containing protein n=1 Tax=Rhipicephalus microplus TaxID=6941 RepID=A0A9J6EK19_RHIMP|nr:hypothetical protein HPB51_000796 [Rhipicephalus microplus]